jgi:hypothetical protein
VHDFTREALALVVDTSLDGQRVVRALDVLIARHGRLAMIVSDNGTELTSRAVLGWTNRTHPVRGRPAAQPRPAPRVARYHRRAGAGMNNQDPHCGCGIEGEQVMSFRPLPCMGLGAGPFSATSIGARTETGRRPLRWRT